jgi:hypothetical protein
MKIAELIASIIVENDKADRSLVGTQQKFKAVGDEAEKADKKVTGLGKGVNTLGASSDGLKGRLGSLLSTVNSFDVGIGGLAVGIGAAATAMYAGVQNAIEYASSLKDLSQETGVGIETLSVLNVAARQAGIGIDSAANAASKYFIKIAEAANGNKEARKDFERFGIDVKAAFENPDQALKDLLTKLAAIPNAAERVDAAQKLAGKSGKELAAIALEMDGNWQRLEQTARDLGVTIDRDLADKSDKLGDTFELMKLKAEGAFLDLARGALPELQKAVDELTGKVGDNSGGWQQLGRDMGSFASSAAGVISALAEVGNWLDQAKAKADAYGNSLHNALMRHAPSEMIALEATLRTMEGNPRIKPLNAPWDDAYAQRAEMNTWGNSAPPSKPSFPTAPSGKRGGGRSGASNSAEQNELRQLALFNRELEAVARQHNEILEREYQLGIVKLDEYVERANDENEEHYNNQLRAFAREEQIARAHAKNATDLKNKLEDIKLDRADAEDAFYKERQRISDDALRAQASSTLSLERQLADTQESIREGVLDRLEALANAGIATQTEYEKRRAELAQEAFNEQKILLELELKQFGTTLDRKTAIGNALIKLDQDRANEAVKASRRIIAAMQAEHGVLPNPSGMAELERGIIVGGNENDPHPSGLTNLLKQIEEAKDKLRDFKSDFEDAFVGAFDRIGEGFDAVVLDMLQSFASMLQEMLLKAAAARISDALFGGGKDGGTGWVGSFLKILGIGVSAAAGGFGGGAGGGASSGGVGMGSMLGFADGGRPPLDRPSIVGERGKELFWPDAAGQIISNDEIRKALGERGDGEMRRGLNIQNVNFSFPHVRDRREAKATEAQMMRAFMGMLERQAQLG